MAHKNFDAVIGFSEAVVFFWPRQIDAKKLSASRQNRNDVITTNTFT